MGLVDRVLSKRQARAWPVGKGELVQWDGPAGHDQSLFSPEEYGDYLATSNDIYSIVSLRARMMSQLELKFYNGRGSDKQEKPDSDAAKLYRYVNPFWTKSRLTRMDELSMGTWGESFWAVEYERGQPKELWWLKASRVQPITHATKYIEAYAYNSVSGEIITFEPHEIIWHRYPNPLDEFSPLAPLAAARLAADSAISMMQANNQAFSNGLSIAGLVVPPGQDKVVFSDDQAKDLEVALKRKFTGAKNAHKWAVLRHEARFLPLQMNQKDAEFLGGLNMTFRMACRAYGMPAPLLGDMEHATLANLRELQRGAWEQTLIPDAILRAEEVEEQYLPLFRGGPDHCEHDTDGVPALQESASESWTREMQALDRGGITINEWRKRRGWPPVEWGDKPYMPANKGPVGDDGVPQLPETANDKKLPDDEVNPSNKPTAPREFDHIEARNFLSMLHLNGVKV
jgi:HK97 family phage portal protein